MGAISLAALGFLRGSGCGVRDTWGTSKDGPGDSLRQQRVVFPGPRRLPRRAD